jgi:predicted Fe-Mo cluster-binding NifX family protein
LGKTAELKIAFASRDGKNVTDHFGCAEEYIVDGEVRAVTSPRQCNNPHDAFEGVVDKLKDCQAIVAVKFGEAAVEYIKSRGIRIFQAQGEIEAVRKGIESKCQKQEL